MPGTDEQNKIDKIKSLLKEIEVANIGTDGRPDNESLTTLKNKLAAYDNLEQVVSDYVAQKKSLYEADKTASASGKKFNLSGYIDALETKQKVAAALPKDPTSVTAIDPNVPLLTND